MHPGLIEKKEPVVRSWSVDSVYASSNQNLNILPPKGKPRAFDYFLCLGVGNLSGEAFSGVGNFTFWLGVCMVSGFRRQIPKVSRNFEISKISRFEPRNYEFANSKSRVSVNSKCRVSKFKISHFETQNSRHFEFLNSNPKFKFCKRKISSL